MLIFMNLMIMMMSIIFLFLNHPLSFGLILLLQSILISSITGFMNFSFWFSYILFLIMVGGMLVLFIYMTSIASNKKFKFSFKTMMLMMFMLLISFMLLFMDNFYYSFLYSMFDSMNQNDFKNNYSSMNKYINFPNNFIMFMMILYLFITLIDLATPSNISTMWNFGSLLGLCLIIQILTGLFLAMHYCPNIELAFNSISHICRDVNYGWLIRTLHANGASFF